ncbi:MAG: D-sedoheptulose 7-phosphate isomerase [Gammaproteobacteria bacterium]
MKATILRSIDEHARALRVLREQLVPQVGDMSKRMLERVQQGGTVFWCGNGGSASDAEHLAAELVGRFNRERNALSSVALTANTSTLTSIGNDYGFDDVFTRQVQGLVRAGDVLVGLSTSGNSENVLRAVDRANGQGALTIGLLGRDGGRIAQRCALSVVVPVDDTARIQEMHILIGHIVCDLIEQACTGTA